MVTQDNGAAPYSPAGQRDSGEGKKTVTVDRLLGICCDFWTCVGSVERAAYARVISTDAATATRSPAAPEQSPDEKQQRCRHQPSPLLAAAVTALLVLVLWPASALGMRGPHHPRGEVIKHQHYQPSPEQHTKLTQDELLLQDKEHIREDLGDWVTDEALDKMSSEELQFHYFKVHDSDQNTKLDGLELLRAIMHTAEDHGHGEDHGHADHEDQEANAISSGEDPEKAPTPIEYYIELIDEVLREDDTDNDGFLSYAEYVASRNQSTKRRASDIVARPDPLKALPGMQTK